MKFISTIHTAYKAVKLHKVRSSLTILGLVIGVTSIILVMNLGQGIKSFVLGQLEVFGTDYIQIEIKVPSTDAVSTANALGQAQGISITTLKLEDAEEIKKHPNVRDYFAGIIGQEVVSFESANETSILWGVSGSFFDLFTAQAEEGQGFTDEENRSQARVAVIGHGLREDLFGQSEAIGRRISIGKQKFTVVGVMEEQGDAFFMDLDTLVYIPIQTLQKQLLGVNHIQFITAYLHDPDQAAATAVDITDIMRNQHEITDPKKDDFSVTTSDEALEILGAITSGINILLIAIAGISLLVGGVGIMNTMYVSVSERTYEIGLRKAVGATKNNILLQFLYEAVFLTFTGGLIGVILGSILSTGAALGAQNFGFDWQISFSLNGLILAVGFSVLVGLVFGIYPARKAASLQPVEALRAE
jgi:putative ABC transport system permease protein